MSPLDPIHAPFTVPTILPFDWVLACLNASFTVYQVTICGRNAIIAAPRAILRGGDSGDSFGSRFDRSPFSCQEYFYPLT